MVVFGALVWFVGFFPLIYKSVFDSSSHNYNFRSCIAEYVVCKSLFQYLGKFSKIGFFGLAVHSPDTVSSQMK